MNPMIRSNPAPARQQPLHNPRRVTIFKVMAWLSFVFGALGLLSGLLMAGMMSVVSGSLLLVLEALSARAQSTQERLEGISKELTLMRQMFAQIAAPQSKGVSQEAADVQNVSAQARGYAQPQPAGD
jgi:hypothetical protein